MNTLSVDNLDKLNPLAVKIATAIVNAKFGPEKCKCCRQKLPRDAVGDMIDAWASEFNSDSKKVIAEVHAVILNVLIVELSLLSLPELASC